MIAHLIDDLLPGCVLALLPLVGTLAGPVYAPLVFGMGAVRFFYRWRAERRLTWPDAGWVVIAGGFVALCWASWLWSVAPVATLRGAIQMTSVLLAALIVLAQPPLACATAGRLLPAMAIALLAAGIVLALDAACGWPLQRWLSGGAANAGTKYNRGVAYALLLAWPVLGRLWIGGRAGFALCLIGGLCLMLGFGVGLTGRLAAGASVLVLGLAWLLPRRIGPVLMAAGALFAALAPLLLRRLSLARNALAPYLKQSGGVRLEIWNYMTARVLERPWFGHGLWSASRLHPRLEELAGYAGVTLQGVYPHDQWLQAWVELGAAGAALALAASLLALARVRQLAPPLQPFAYAAFAAAATLSLADFDLATDSWWAAIALCGWLFSAAAEPPPAAALSR